MRLLACLIVAPQRGYDEPAILSYAISSFCPTSADGLQRTLGLLRCSAEHLGQQVHVLIFLALRNQKNPSVNTENKTNPHQERWDWRQHTTECDLHGQADQARQQA